MADNPYITGLTSGVPVAAEDIGGVEYQRVKIVDGRPGSTIPVAVTTTAIPGTTEGGLVVAVKPGVSVTIQQGASMVAQVSGAVFTTAMPHTTEAAMVVRIAGSAVEVIISTVIVAGEVNISGIVPVTTQASVSVSGLPVWFNPGALVGLSGTQVVSVAPGVSVTVVTQLGTQVVSVVPGLSVSAVVSGAVTISGTAIVTLATGGVVTLVGAVSVTGVSLGVVVSGVVSISNLPAISISGIVPVTTQSSVSIGGLPIWFAPGATVAIVPGLSVTISGQVVTNTGTQVVTLATGGVVTLVGVAGVTNTGTAVVTLATGGVVTLVGTVGVNVVAAVSVSGIVPVTTQTSASVSGLPVWFSPGALVALSGTGIVTLATGGVVTLVGVAAVSLSAVTAAAAPLTSVGVGIPVWIVGGQTATGIAVGVTITSGGVISIVPGVSVTISGMVVTITGNQLVSLSAITAAAAPLTSVGVGLPVWIVGGQTATGVAVLASLTTGGVVTMVGIVPVTVSGIVPQITQAAVSGLPLWLAPTQTIIVGTSISQVISTILGTQVVTLATGGVVTMAGVVTVNISNVADINIKGAQISTGLVNFTASGVPIWVVGGQTATGMALMVTISNIAPTSGMPLGTSGLGLPVWIVGGQTATGFPIIVSMSNLTATSGAPAAASLGLPVQICGQTSVDVTVAIPATNATGMVVRAAGATAYIPVVIMVSSTVIAVGGTTYLMTIWTGGTQVGVGQTQYPVPAGKVLRIFNIQLGIVNSATSGGSVIAWVNMATASGSLTSANQATIGRAIMVQQVISAGLTLANMPGGFMDISAATTIGIMVTASQTVNLQGIFINGALLS